MKGYFGPRIVKKFMVVIPLLLVRNEFCRFSNSQVTKVTDRMTENSRVDIVLRNKVALHIHVVFVGIDSSVPNVSWSPVYFVCVVPSCGPCF